MPFRSPLLILSVLFAWTLLAPARAGEWPPTLDTTNGTTHALD